MLVLLSFGLVLVATVLLVIGLLSDSGLPLIYVSIGASALAGLVLIVAVRRSRNTGPHMVDEPLPAAPLVEPPEPPEPPAPPPVPLVHPPDPEPEERREEPDDPVFADPEPRSAPDATAQPRPRPELEPFGEPEPLARAAPPPGARPVAEPAPEPDPAPVPAPAESVAEPEPVPEREPAPAEPVGEASGPIASQNDEPVAAFEFPILDYDELTVEEIMPLLPQLFPDELDVVLARERGTKDRAAILARLDQLRVSGARAEGTTMPKVVLEPDRVRAEVAEPDPAPSRAAADVFPIAAYDSLTVAQILPLIRQLEVDELIDVRARETAGAGRTTILRVIAERLGEPPPPTKRTASKKKRAPAKKTTKKSAAKKKAPAKKSTKKKSSKKKSAASKKQASDARR